MGLTIGNLSSFGATKKNQSLRLPTILRGVMDNSFNILSKEKFLLITVNREGQIKAAFITYSKYGENIWLTDVDITKMQLDNYPSILEYLQHSIFSLELSHSNNGIITAEITCMQRVGGYKEPLQRAVKYRCIGYECLSNLENILSLN